MRVQSNVKQVGLGRWLVESAVIDDVLHCLLRLAALTCCTLSERPFLFIEDSQ